ncbi:MAG: ATP-binding cassette domain-containing protein [Candidatus Hodarchaeales archaeon]|jgi:ATP-binding cassette subfamily B protein
MVEIHFDDIWFHFPNNKDYILESFNWKWTDGGIIGLLGTNGCGKTTLLKIIAGIYSTVRGRFLINGKHVKSYKSTKEIVTYVPENAKLFLIGPTPRIDLYRILRDEEVVNDSLNLHGLSDIANKKLYHLSEGQRRLIAIFNAFHISREIVLLDEPTIGMDRKGRLLFFKLLELAKKEKKLVIIATNDPRVYPCFDKILVIQDKTLLMSGSPKEVLYLLEEKTGLLPNQIVRLVHSVENQTDWKLPQLVTVDELSEFLLSGRLT